MAAPTTFERVKTAFEDAGFATGIHQDAKWGECLCVYTPNAAKALLTTLDRYADHKRQIFTGSDDVVGCLHDFIQNVIEFRTSGDVFPAVLFFPLIHSYEP